MTMHYGGKAQMGRLQLLVAPTDGFQAMFKLCDSDNAAAIKDMVTSGAVFTLRLGFFAARDRALAIDREKNLNRRVSCGVA